jgi:uncharacterized protein YecE (DUF72 family)
VIRIGVAGWTIPPHLTRRFPAEGTHLHRYARVLSCVEINSAFYRSHARQTYVRWAESTPRGFAFAVKLSRTITHEWCLTGTGRLVRQFLEETAGLGAKRGAILAQLPPSLTFSAAVAGRFFGGFRDRYDGTLACEPRHQSWFTEAAGRLLRRHRVARVAADPPRALDGDLPGGWLDVAYFRLHGSPRTYWSRYDAAFLDRLADRIGQAAARGDVWCIFDNTAAGAAPENAFELRAHLGERPRIVGPGA